MIGKRLDIPSEPKPNNLEMDAKASYFLGVFMLDFSKFVSPRDLITKRVSAKRLNLVYSWYSEIARLQNPDKVLEFGVGFGYSSYAMLSGCALNMRIPSLLTWIDFCEGKVAPDGNHDYALGLLRGAFDIKLDDRFLNSHEIQDFDHKYDLISIDGDHTVSGCLHDLRVSEKSLAIDGHIVCHDTNDRPVRDAIDTFCVEQEGKFVQMYFPDLYQGCTIVHRNDGHLESCPMFGLFDYVQQMNNKEVL